MRGRPILVDGTRSTSGAAAGDPGRLAGHLRAPRPHPDREHDFVCDASLPCSCCHRTATGVDSRTSTGSLSCDRIPIQLAGIRSLPTPPRHGRPHAHGRQGEPAARLFAAGQLARRRDAYAHGCKRRRGALAGSRCRAACDLWYVTTTAAAATPSPHGTMRLIHTQAPSRPASTVDSQIQPPLTRALPSPKSQP